MRNEPAQPKTAVTPGNKDVCSAPMVRSIVRKSALLNTVIVLTSFPVLVYAGGAKAVVPVLEIMAGISVLIWTATFAMSSLLTFPRIFRAPATLAKRDDSQDPTEQ